MFMRSKADVHLPVEELFKACGVPDLLICDAELINPEHIEQHQHMDKFFCKKFGDSINPPWKKQQRFLMNTNGTWSLIR